MKQLDWAEVIGHRVLIYSINGSKHYPDEMRVIMISPSGKYVKLEYPNGYRCWKLAEDFVILEKLE